MSPRVAIFFVTLSLACLSEADAIAIHEMKGFVVNWSEGTTAGSFDLEVGGNRTHFEINMKRATVNGTPVSTWADGAPSPFGTHESPKRLCALVVYHEIATDYRDALTITILEAKPPPNACS
jgi:hypothetical protein